MYCLPFFILMETFFLLLRKNIKHFSERSENVFEETITSCAGINRFVNAINWTVCWMSREMCNAMQFNVSNRITKKMKLITHHFRY